MAKLQSELKKKSGFQSPAQEATLNILRTSDRLQNRFGKFVREYGLTSSQYNVLRILRGEGQPLPSLEIADRMIQVVPAITGLIDRLEKQQLVSRQRSSEDRRIIHVSITPRGLQLLKKMDKPLLELHQKLLGHLPKSELTQITRLMEKVRASQELTGSA
ncbi:HTH-type transcriptional regulator MhqR [Aeoliella mucimassa]|uniref:HTH-type transcriptional regulator MhqR n=2 Tax=Aeoliella mucimassa TaxID=2527972 RepID=A0A518AJL0_9BACT|nr:HTH-type transcriptional regulator MhqR [Aeoliella mucimassa]